MRMAGLASGLQVDDMVKELMKARRTTYDNMVKKRTQLEWKQEDYRSMSTKIADFRYNKLTSFNLSSAISAKTSEVGGDTNALTLNATSSTAAGTLNVQVNQVATASNSVYTFNTTERAQSLEDLGFELSAPGADTVDVRINGKNITVSKDAKLSDLAQAINANSSNVKATALYDANTGRLSISASQTGIGQLSLQDDVFTGRVPTSSQEGVNAEITVNGLTYEQAGNRFNINGVDFTVKAASQSGSTTTLNVVKDTTKIIDTIKSFITEYNSLIGSINTELSEEKYRTFKPLTDDEKKEMSDKEVDLWESKARSGSLKNDSILSGMVSDLRIAATSLISGIADQDGNRLSIGITTGSYSDKGKLILDETKLRTALETDADSVISLFTAKGTDTSPGSSTSGVFAKMTATTTKTLSGLREKAGTSLISSDINSAFAENSLINSQLRTMKEQESRMTARLTAIENQYYKQFSAMETAINKFNSQSSALTSFSN
ncbi:hypothetical protein BBD42_11170 [Paenibacillus sp. BIHB 4019]|uniref:Flagellar hook-associated protein 2 n=1 Tax=Paenibacillus sp. BIHB 4019 TaxID=1870819 RepID=A0A1B2DGV7_9BACL|nr:flagellar filament capping protein FliD [Paenibacillus sp. BIHB 4019]ANY66967.1 hypothetical protein BBD42_11170 [Paenibacillus sp. BIHB 4019]